MERRDPGGSGRANTTEWEINEGHLEEWKMVKMDLSGSKSIKGEISYKLMIVYVKINSN